MEGKPEQAFDFGLMVQTVQKEEPEQRQKEKEEVERFSILDGLRKYASGESPESVLLVGRPGSGKSTELARLLLEDAMTQTSRFLPDSGSSVHSQRIPILVELRYWQSSIEQLILDDLLKYHLLQNRKADQIEFRHQLIQEYYAAEELLRRLPHLSDEELKRNYLNYLKWTEPVALMLALLDEEDSALRVVRLAMDEVDLILGARLAGEVKPGLRATTVGWIDKKELPVKLKVQCWEVSHSEQAVEGLLAALKDSEEQVCWRAAWALGKIGSEQAVDELLVALQDSDQFLRRMAVEALGQIGSQQAVPALLNTLEDSDIFTRRGAVEALGQIGSQEAVAKLQNALQDSDSRVRKRAVKALWKIRSNKAVEALCAASKDSSYKDVRAIAAEVLGKNDSEPTAKELPVSPQVPSYTPKNAMLGNIRNKKAEKRVESLLDGLKKSDVEIRRDVVDALAEIGSKQETLEKINGEQVVEVVDRLLVALKDSDEDVRRRAAEALGEIGSKHKALGKIKPEQVVEGLLTIIQDPNKDVQRSAVEALGQIGIGSKQAVEA